MKRLMVILLIMSLVSGAVAIVGAQDSSEDT